MSKCEKHNCGYEIRQMEHGKTMYVCPKCEREQIDMIRKFFVGNEAIESPKLPSFHG